MGWGITHRYTSSVPLETLGLSLQKRQFPIGLQLGSVEVDANPAFPPMILCRRVVGLHFLSKWNHAGNQPLFPHFIDLTLEVIDIIVGKVRKSSLLQ